MWGFGNSVTTDNIFLRMVGIFAVEENMRTHHLMGGNWVDWGNGDDKLEIEDLDGRKMTNCHFCMGIGFRSLGSGAKERRLSFHGWHLWDSEMTSATRYAGVLGRGKITLHPTSWEVLGLGENWVKVSTVSHHVVFYNSLPSF